MSTVPPPPPVQSGNVPAGPPQNGMGTAALVMGILQFFCLGIVGSILAIIFGRIGMRNAEQGLATNGGSAKAGYWLGIIGVIISVIGIIVWIIVVATSSKG